MSQIAPVVARVPAVPSVPKFSTVMSRFAGGLACVVALGLLTAVASLGDAKAQDERANLNAAQSAPVVIAQGLMSHSAAGN